MKEKLVSIIIPVYNAEKYIKETIMTVQKQTYKNYEVIFVDDCSKDSSREIIKSNLTNNMTLIELEKHSGTAIARNEGIKVAKGRYLSFLDADDLWHTEKTKKQLEFMNKNGYAFTYTAYQYINKNNTRKGKKVNVQKSITYKKALKNIRIASTSVIIDLKQIPKKECFMVNVMNEDVATWWKLLKKGYTAYGLTEVLVYYRRHKESKTSSKFKNAKYRWQTYRQEENLPLIKSIYYFIHYVFYGIVKRV